MVNRGFKRNHTVSYKSQNRHSRRLIFSGNQIKPKKEFPKIPWKYIVYVIIGCTFIYFIFFSKYFMIKDIFIQGNVLVTSDKISSYIPRNSNIFRFNISKVRKNILNENAEIREIEIFRGIPNAIKVVVFEHENKMIWQTEGKYYLVSTQGEITKQIDNTSNFKFPIVTDSKNIPVEPGEYISSASFVSFVNNVRDQILSVANLNPTNFEIIETTFDVNLHTDSDIYIKLNTLRSSAKQLDNLKKLLVAKRGDIHEYIDLRIDGLAYYK